MKTKGVSQLNLVKESLADMLYRLERGCSNQGCVIRPPAGGVGTNSMCHCRPAQIARELKRIARTLEDSLEWGKDRMEVQVKLKVDVTSLRPGDEVLCNDYDDPECSKLVKIKSFELFRYMIPNQLFPTDVVRLVDETGEVLECYSHELEWPTPAKKKAMFGESK